MLDVDDLIRRKWFADTIRWNADSFPLVAELFHFLSKMGFIPFRYLTTDPTDGLARVGLSFEVLCPPGFTDVVDRIRVIPCPKCGKACYHWERRRSPMVGSPTFESGIIGRDGLYGLLYDLWCWNAEPGTDARPLRGD